MNDKVRVIAGTDQTGLHEGEVHVVFEFIGDHDAYEPFRSEHA